MNRLLVVGAASVALTACGGEKIELNPPPPPADWLTCAEMPARPDLEPLERITLPDGRVVYLAAQTNARDAEIARYIVRVRDAWFSCSNNLAKVRDYYAGQE